MLFRALWAIVLLSISTVYAPPIAAEISRNEISPASAQTTYAEALSCETARKTDPTLPQKRMYREIFPGSESRTGVVAGSQAAVVESPAQLLAGRRNEAVWLQKMGETKGNLWTPAVEEMESATFRTIVGKPRYTPTGEPRGVIFDAIKAGNQELKTGTSPLGSSYQLRLMTYKGLKDNAILGLPDANFTIYTNRPVRPAFAEWLKRWGATVKPIE